MKYEQLAAIDVGGKIEKKNGLSYVSWVWAVDQLQRLDEKATWEYGEPKQWGDTWMVFCTVHAFGKTRTAYLPVMDHRNKAIANPDAFAVNTAMQRCLAKAIALHGIGLYVYAGEDLPPTIEGETVSEALKNRAIEAANGGLKSYAAFWEGLDSQSRRELLPEHDKLKKQAADITAKKTEKVAA